MVVDSDVQQPEITGFRIVLHNFEGPFDLLLQLISAQKLDVTDVALAQVTDEFVGYVKQLGVSARLDEITEFLVVAATLLDLKAARLVPRGEVDDVADLALLESRDLLFARLLQYRAYRQVADLFAVWQASARLRYPRVVGLEERFVGLLPPVVLGHSAESFAEFAASVFRPRPPGVGEVGEVRAVGGLGVPGTVRGSGSDGPCTRPGVIGRGMLVAALAGGSAVFGGALAIILVYVARSMPSGQRSGIASLQQIDKSIDEASTSLGASGLQTFVKVTLPLIRPAFIAGLTYAFARSMTTLSPIVFITTPKTKIMTSQILAEVDAGRFGNAFAFCTILIVIVMAVIGLTNLLVRDKSVAAQSRAGL